MKRFFKKANLHQGTSSAVLLSILIHFGLFLIATSLVVFTVLKKEETPFEAPRATERPKMKLKKPKMKVKTSSRPKSPARIVTKSRRSAMPVLDVPEMGGMGDGLGDVLGDGFDMMPDLDNISIFGGSQTIGNDFEGTLYNLNRDRQGRLTGMNGEAFRQKLRDFVIAGWDTQILKQYHTPPKKLYTTHFMIPEVPSPMAPDVFGERDMEGYYFCLHYKGKLACQEPITFRFWGNGDAYMFIRINGKEVFLSSWPGHKSYFDWWQTTSSDDEKYYLGNRPMTVGDWITLEPDKPVDMDIMFGEWAGHALAAMLNVEVQGVEYEKNRQGGPILPAFKTAPFSRDLLDEIYAHLAENETCLTNGPIFADYSIPTRAPAPEGSEILHVSEPEHAADDPPAVRNWTLLDGRTFEGELVASIHRKISIKNTSGKVIRIPQEEFSLADQEFIELETPPDLDISFSKQSEQRIFPDIVPDQPGFGKYPLPKAAEYVFSTTVKQRSPGSYDQELQVELFVIGAEIKGNRYILLDRKQIRFTPTKENDRSIRFSGNPVELTDFQIGAFGPGFERRGKKYSSYLVVVTDRRGKIIAHQTPKKWLFNHYENLKEVPVGKYFDETCTRAFPTRPKTLYY